MSLLEYSSFKCSFVQIISLWILVSMCMHIYLYTSSCLACSLDPLYRVNSIISLMVKGVHEIQFHILLHILIVEFALCIVVVLTTSDPICLGTILYLNVF